MVNFVASQSIGSRYPSAEPRFSGSLSNNIKDITIDSIFMMRHGWAEHNELGIFASAFPEPRQINLLPRGVSEIEAGFRASQSQLFISGRPLVIVSSPILRARQSSEVITRLIGSDTRVEVRDELRERGCGKYLEGFPYRSYLKYFKKSVEHDNQPLAAKSRMKSFLHQSRILSIPSELCKIESCRRVEHRVTLLMREMQLRANKTGELFLFVTHEFTGAVALNAFLGRHPGMFWENRHIANGVILPLTREQAEMHFGVKHKNQNIKLSDYSFQDFRKSA